MIRHNAQKVKCTSLSFLSSSCFLYPFFLFPDWNWNMQWICMHSIKLNLRLYPFSLHLHWSAVCLLLLVAIHVTFYCSWIIGEKDQSLWCSCYFCAVDLHYVFMHCHCILAITLMHSVLIVLDLPCLYLIVVYYLLQMKRSFDICICAVRCSDSEHLSWGVSSMAIIYAYHVFMTVKSILSVCACFCWRRVWCAFSSMKQWNTASAFV